MALSVFWDLQKPARKRNAFTEDLVRGILAHLEPVDTKIRAYAENWKFERIAIVDRCILRLAIYELLFRDDIPPIVSINEALELAKKYSTEDSTRFINGILDRVKDDLQRPLRTAVREGNRKEDGNTQKT
jgi:N utilization substance protein B